MLYALITSEKKGGQPAAQQYLLMISLPQGFIPVPGPSIGISQGKNSKKKKKQLWPVRMGHRHEPRLNKKHTFTATKPPRTSHYTAPSPPERQSRQYENTLVTTCAVVADDVPHRVAH